MAALIFTSCKPTGADVRIPSGSTCNDRTHALDCTRVPPQARDTSSPPRFALDGQMSDGEYWGAVELPYSDARHHDASGKLYVTFESPTTAHPTTTMHLFAHHIPVDRNSQELRLYLDLKRLDRAPTGLDDEDRMIALPLRGEVEVRAVSWFGSASNWYAVTDPNFDARLGRCAEAGSPGEPTDGPGGPITDATSFYCDGEFQVELSDAQLSQSSAHVPILGMAFGMYSVDPGNSATHPDSRPYFSGALPESFVNHLADDTDRTQELSLELATPEGVPIKFLSWNLARWGTWLEWFLNSSSPFKHVDLADMAEIMKSYDVVAVQEMWSVDDARELLAEINALRPADEQMALAGPIDFPAEVLSVLGRALIGQPIPAALNALQNTQGGVFIFSRFPVVESNHIVYDRCIGEDCIKAKGVLHVRLALRPPGSGSESRPECSKVGGVSSGLGCPADPTGEMYVDVYDTHMQAGYGQVCRELDTWYGKLVDLVVHTLHPGAAFLNTYAHCDEDPVTVAHAQYEQLADFVARTSSDPNRTIIAGDFNTNGRRIGPVDPDDDAAVQSLAKYETLLHTLGLYEASLTWPSGPAHVDLAQDDTINLHPDAFEWDIDHGDVAREEDARYHWLKCGVGTQSGTANDTECRRTPTGGMGVPASSEEGCTVGHLDCPDSGCDLWDDGRLDYIFVGAFPQAVYHADPAGDPPSAPPRPRHPSYVLGRGPRDGPLWSRLEPIRSGAELTCGVDRDMNLTLLSDHAPVAGNLMLFPMRQPARFHAEWDHALSVRVSSTDVTGTSDCIGGICGETEVYFNIDASRASLSGDEGSVWPYVPPFHTNHCHGWTLPNEDQNCMVRWALWRRVTAGDTLKDQIDFKMVEADTFRDDHYSLTEPGSDPRFIFDWDRSTLVVTNQDNDPLPSQRPTSVQFRNTDPIRIPFQRPRPDLPPDLSGTFLFRQQTPFAGFTVHVREDDLTRPWPVAP